MSDYPFFKRQQLIWESQCTPTQKLFLLAVNQFIGENNCCWPSISKLTNLTAYARRTISKCCEELESLGIISRSERFIDGKQTTNRYEINWKNLEAGGASGSPPPCTTITPPMHEDHTELINITNQLKEEGGNGGKSKKIEPGKKRVEPVQKKHDLGSEKKDRHVETKPTRQTLESDPFSRNYQLGAEYRKYVTNEGFIEWLQKNLAATERTRAQVMRELSFMKPHRLEEFETLKAYWVAYQQTLDKFGVAQPQKIDEQITRSKIFYGIQISAYEYEYAVKNGWDFNGNKYVRNGEFYSQDSDCFSGSIGVRVA